MDDIHKSSYRLHLHIGRNKAGSTTLQRHWLDNIGELRAAGMEYAMFGQPAPAGTSIASLGSHHALMDFVRDRDGGSVLVSHEGICCFNADVTRFMAKDLAALDMQVILYVRPYREWVVSSYSFDVRLGLVGHDFDHYFETMRKAVSIWPIVEIWGEAIGWRNVRVRSLDPRDLVGGDLAQDGDAAIGVDLPMAGPAPKANASPSWMVIELLRFITGRDEALGWDGDRRAIAMALHHYMEASLTSLGVDGRRAGYLRLDQARVLMDAYNSDLAALASKGCRRLQPDAGLDMEERAFLPALAFAPAAVLRDTRRRALEPEAARLHPEAAAFVQGSGFTGLCGL